VPVPEELVSSRQGLDAYFDKPLIIGLRPSSLEDANFAPEGWPRIKGEVAVTEELGSEVNVIFHMAAPQVHHDIMIAKFDKAAKDEVEAEELAGEGQSLWTARVNPKTQAKVGRSVDLAVDTGGFHFFNLDTGQAIGRVTEGEGARERREARSDQA
jgi:multiple sugar transport system ATP-binding protein